MLLVGCGTADRADSAHPGPSAVAADASHRVHPGPDAGPDEMSEKNLVLDENGAPMNHTDALWGNYIDKDGKPAVGWHSHDPETGKVR